MIPTSIVIVLSSVFTMLAMAAFFVAGWLAARRGNVRRFTAKPAVSNAEEDQPVVTRITLADLRARMRRLEAIAAGIDL